MNKTKKHIYSICCLVFCPFAKTSPIFSRFDTLHKHEPVGKRLEGCTLDKRIRPGSNEDVAKYCPLNE